MPRPRRGTARLRGARWYARVVLPDGTRHEWPVPVEPGESISARQATLYAETMQDRATRGAWDPRRPVLAAPSTTVGDVAREWAKTACAEEAAALERYLVGDPLAAMALTAVRPRHLLEYVARLKATRSRKGGTLAARTIRGAYFLAHRVFAHAVVLELIPASPCVLPRSALPKVTDKTPGARARWIFAPAEVCALATDPRVPADERVLHALLFLTGMRSGEASALRWSDWDRDREPLGALYVSRSVERVSRREKSTKSDVTRAVPVHPFLAQTLRAWWATGFKDFFGSAPTPDGLVVPDPKTHAARAQGDTWERLQRALKALELRPRRAHDTRRTFISLARDGGATADVVGWITHTSRRTMVDVYSELKWTTLCDAVHCIRVPGLVAGQVAGQLPPASADSPVDPSESLARPTRLEFVSPADAGSLTSESQRFGGPIPTDGNGAVGDNGATAPLPDAAPEYAHESALWAWHARALLLESEGEWN